ncbi:hypothetical protein [Henriciella algicola]|uniref:Uncharacterized protein n=1 Tax=Henriciella algicola TaxID=1608422 RepID=A0A399RPL4_9PROT|nr:hypothetical protein [Henriciella algicola]RIJ31792.1 hypothetical protein D1222_05995 [Henriciella algicola]
MVWVDAFCFLIVAVGLAQFVYGFRSTRRLESSFFGQVMEDDPSRDSEDARRHIIQATNRRKPGQRGGPSEAGLRLREAWPEETLRLQKAQYFMRVGWNLATLMIAHLVFWKLRSADNGDGFAFLAMFLVFGASFLIARPLKVWE